MNGLDKDKDKIVFIDKLRAQQILINLITNSIKFSKSGDLIEVKFKFFEVENPTTNLGVTISVRDFGIGISDEDRL
jgi:signal transduction histidine kinase